MYCVGVGVGLHTCVCGGVVFAIEHYNGVMWFLGPVQVYDGKKTIVVKYTSVKLF